LTGTKLAHQARAAVARGISYFFGKKSCIARARRGRAGLTVYPPKIQIRDVSLSIARWDHRKSKLGLLHGNFYFSKGYSIPRLLADA
jgi:hypothetical protein